MFTKIYRKSSLGRNQRSSAAVGRWNCSRMLVILVITHSFPLIQQVYTRTDVTYSSSLFRFSFLQRWLRRTVLFITRYLSLKPVCFQTHELIVTATNFFLYTFPSRLAHLRFNVTWILQTRKKIHAALLHAKCVFLNLKIGFNFSRKSVDCQQNDIDKMKVLSK